MAPIGTKTEAPRNPVICMVAHVADTTDMLPGRAVGGADCEALAWNYRGADARLAALLLRVMAPSPARMHLWAKANAAETRAAVA